VPAETALAHPNPDCKRRNRQIGREVVGGPGVQRRKAFVVICLRMLQRQRGAELRLPAGALELDFGAF
jgi:hypothetical protein